MTRILGVGSGDYVDMLLSKKIFSFKVNKLSTMAMVSQVTYCVLITLIKTYHLVISFTLNQRILNIKS